MNDTATSDTEVLDTMLRRIRGLLDMAESTDNEAEQETFFNKASDLMARYRIDQAMVEASRPKADRGQVIERRVNLGSGPYVRARLSLIDSVGDAFGVKTLTSTNWEGRQAILHGFESDIATVEVLYTSLLVQVTRAMKATPVPYHTHGTTFRRNFISGFASRVGQRLTEQNATLVAETQAVADAETGASSDSVALVLSDRKAEVNDFIAKRYGKTRFASLGGSSARYSSEGRMAGNAAGSRADITTGGRVAAGARELAS